MRHFFWVMIILLLAAVLGTLLAKYPGFLLLQLGQSTYAAPLWLVFLSTLLVLLFIYIVYKWLRFFVFIPRAFRHYRDHRRQQKQLTLLGLGLEQFITLDYTHATDNFLKLAKLGFLQAQSLVVALTCAQLTGDLKTQKNIRSRLKKVSTHLGATTLLLVEVDALIDEGSPSALSQARTHLLAIKSSGGEAILTRLLDIYLSEQDFPQALNVYRQLEKKKYPLDEPTRCELFFGLLQQSTKTLASLDQAWKQIPNADKQESRFLYAYTDGLIGLNESALAEKQLIKHLNQHVDADLFNLFSTITPKDGKKQLALAEKWLVDYKPSSLSLLAMGRITARNNLFGRAKHYLEQSLAENRTPEAVQLLATLFIDNNQASDALKVYQKWLQTT